VGAGTAERRAVGDALFHRAGRAAGRADQQVLARAGIRGRSEATIRRYAFSVKVWLNFLEACGVAWDQAGPECLAAFKDWRMSAEDNAAHVEAGRSGTT
jgi:hypothetical protein